MVNIKRLGPFVAIGCLSVLAVSCTEINSISPPQTVCLSPSIEKNIVGKWSFESTFNTGGFVSNAKGLITFDDKGNVIDPDSLFPNRDSETGPVAIKKTYSPRVLHTDSGITGEYMDVYIMTKTGVSTYYFQLVSNECNRIRFRLFHSKDNAVGFILTRK